MKRLTVKRRLKRNRVYLTHLMLVSMALLGNWLVTGCRDWWRGVTGVPVLCALLPTSYHPPASPLYRQPSLCSTYSKPGGEHRDSVVWRMNDSWTIEGLSVGQVGEWTVYWSRTSDVCPVSWVVVTKLHLCLVYLQEITPSPAPTALSLSQTLIRFNVSLHSLLSAGNK